MCYPPSFHRHRLLLAFTSLLIKARDLCRNFVFSTSSNRFDISSTVIAISSTNTHVSQMLENCSVRYDDCRNMYRKECRLICLFSFSRFGCQVEAMRTCDSILEACVITCKVSPINLKQEIINRQSVRLILIDGVNCRVPLSNASLPMDGLLTI